MNSEKALKILALLFGFATIVVAVYTLATRGNAGVSVILMVFALIFTAAYRNKKK